MVPQDPPPRSSDEKPWIYSYPPELVAVVGKLTLGWAHFEHLLDNMIIGMRMIRPQRSRLPKLFDQKVTVFEAEFPAFVGDAGSSIAGDLCKQMREFSIRRADIVHGVLQLTSTGYSIEPVTFLRLNFNKDTIQTVVFETPEKISDLCNEIGQFYYTMLYFHAKYIDIGMRAYVNEFLEREG